MGRAWRNIFVFAVRLVHGFMQHMSEPEHLRHAVVDSASPLVTRLKVGADAFVGLVLRQSGSIVTSLDMAHAYVASSAFENIPVVIRI